MQAAAKLEVLSVEEYLARERTSPIRHEYVGGVAHAMAGSSKAHNTLSGNLFTSLRTHLRGKPCQVFMADVKVHLETAGDVFYYPDVVVTCDKRDTDPYLIRYPKVVIEVLSAETEQIDRREKFLAYTQSKTLQEYVLVTQDRMEVTVFRRAHKWQPELLRRSSERLRLVSLQFSLPLSAVYEGVKV